MGLYDREYYRDDEPAGFRVGAPRSMVIALIIVNSLVYLACLFTQKGRNDYPLIDLLSLNPEALAHPLQWYRFVTNGFTHSPEITHVLFNMFGLWVFGRDVESIYGPWEFLRIYLVVVVLGSVIWALAEISVWGSIADPPPVMHSLLGASGAVMAITMLFVRHFPQRILLLMFVLPVRAWVVGVLYVVGNVLGLGSNENIAYNVHLVGIAFGLAYFQFHWRLGWLTPTGWLHGLQSWWKRVRPGAPKLRVHAPDPEDRYRKLDEEADRLLDKVHRDGEASLSDKERRALEEYSRRMRQKHR